LLGCQFNTLSISSGVFGNCSNRRHLGALARFPNKLALTPPGRLGWLRPSLANGQKKEA
jgi:hypothetical protein